MSALVFWSMVGVACWAGAAAIVISFFVAIARRIKGSLGAATPCPAAEGNGTRPVEEVRGGSPSAVLHPRRDASHLRFVYREGQR